MKSTVHHIETIREHHQVLGYPALRHPLMSIHRFEDLPLYEERGRVSFTLGFYTITLKRNYDCKAIYGQTSYDFDEGLMGFTAPRQLSVLDPGFTLPQEGWIIYLHPDFLRNSSLAAKIKSFDYFHYAVNEALILSQEEEEEIEQLFRSIQTEYQRPIDTFSRDILLSKIELLLTMSNRFYHRQFITRKTPHSELLTRFEAILDEYFNSENQPDGLPSVGYFAEKLNLSGKYLSDLLVSLTGQTTLQHIHHRLIEKAKEKLAAGTLTVNEIAYELGFNHAQSFSKLFRAKTNLSPVEFRKSFHES
ncbi:helix-turn-helix domain-containing protein [Fluviicola sp.]|uniref:helix-turn-helix domain-containing protein n=1 Tax=Fluviicola sp. TaxID=1917219 RepID=UPI0031D58202